MEVLDSLAEVTNVEELKQSVHLACQLRESILVNCNNSNAEISSESSDYGVQSQRAHLAHQLQSALTALQVMTLDHAPALVSSIGDQMLQRVAEVTSQLFKDLEELRVISVTQVAADQANITKKEKSTVFEEEVQKDVALEEQTIVTADELVASLVTFAEGEPQFTENINETKSKDIEQGTSIESTDTMAQFLGKTKVEESTKFGALGSGVIDSNERVVLIQQQTLSELIVDENVDEVAIVVNTEATSAKDVHCKVTDNLAANESYEVTSNDVKTTAIIVEEVERSAPLTGNFVLSYFITLI